MFRPKAEKASGRAVCRWCGQTIDAGLPVIYLHIGSYKSKGYIHSRPEDCFGRLLEE